MEDSDLVLSAAGPDGSELALSSEDQLLGGVAAGSLAAAVTGRGFEKVWAVNGACGCSCGDSLLQHALVSWVCPHSARLAAGPISPAACSRCTALPAPQLQQLGSGKLEPFLSRAGVWARMPPDDKRTLMELLGDGSLGEDGAEVVGQVRRGGEGGGEAGR